jgi:hypothetical protein
MRASVEFSSASMALLRVEADRFSYALPGACVLGIEHARDWRGEPPLDALTLLGLGPLDGAERKDARVAVLDAGETRLPLLVRGTLTLIHPAEDELLALPHAMQTRAGFISHVAVVDGRPSFFVLSPALMARASR